MKLKNLAAAIASCAAVAVAAPASAAPLANLISGGFNTFDDQSYDMFFDIDGNGLVSDGDVTVGLLRIDDVTEPSTINLGARELYAVFALEVTNTFTQGVGGPGFFNWIPSTVPGLTLAEIVGSPLPAQDRAGDALAAVYTDVGFDYIADQSAGTIGDVDGNAGFTGLDYIHSLSTTGTLELVAGFLPAAEPEDDDFINVNLPTTSALGILNGATQNDLFASFNGGLSILTNLSGRTFLREVCTPLDATGGPGTPCALGSATKHDMRLDGTVNGLSQAAVNEDFFGNTGVDDAGDPDFIPGAAGSMEVCSGGACTNYMVYGAGNDSIFRIASVPEPATLAIVGLGLLGIGFGRRVASRKA